MSGLVLGIRLALAGVFAVAGGAKLADLDGSRRALRAFGAHARLASVGGVALPLPPAVRQRDTPLLPLVTRSLPRVATVPPTYLNHTPNPTTTEPRSSIGG